MLEPERDEDLELMRRVTARDETAFARLFDRHSALVLGVLSRMLRNRAEAEEILQEAFLQAWEQAGRYDPARATPRGWLLVLARSRALDRIRSRTARSDREERSVLDGAQPTTTEPLGSSELEAEERRRGVAAALATIPPEQRRAIELAFFSGLTHREIAERLATPLGTVKSRILLGMNKLREVLGAGGTSPRGRAHRSREANSRREEESW